MLWHRAFLVRICRIPFRLNENDKSGMENSVTEHMQSVTQNSSLADNCIKIIFSEMEYLPWDNPDNIVSAEVETLARKFKNNLLIFLFLIGGPGNVINMAVFYKQGLQDRVNLCLFALALADELTLMMATLHHGEQLYIQFTTKEIFGPMATFLTNKYLGVLIGFCFVSPVLSAIIATERCLCVLNPLKFSTLLRTRTMGVIIVTVYVVVEGLFFIVIFRNRIACVYDPVSGIVVKTVVEGDFYKANRKFIDYLDSFVFGVGLPGVVMVVVTTATLLTIMKLRQAAIWRSETSSSISPPEVALTKMLVGNSILFMACIIPVALIRISWLFMPEMNAGRRHHNLYLSGIWIIDCFLYVNSTCNIFVYYVMGSRYRETFWALFGRKVTPETSGKEEK